MVKKISFFPLVFGIQFSLAQQNYPDSVTVSVSNSTDVIKNIYYQQRGEEAAIYTGTLHYAYSPDIEGIAYFYSVDWQKGDVDYDGILYKNILMKYDQVKDQLIVTSNETSGKPVCLNSSRVKQFSFSGYKFIKIDNNTAGSALPGGFYRQLNSGNILALARTVKTLTEKIVDNKNVRKFEEKTRYYVSRGSQYYPIGDKKDLLNVLKDHKKEIQDFIKGKKLNYKKDPENMIVSVVDFCTHP